MVSFKHFYARNVIMPKTPQNGTLTEFLKNPKGIDLTIGEIFVVQKLDIFKDIEGTDIEAYVSEEDGELADECSEERNKDGLDINTSPQEHSAFISLDKDKENFSQILPASHEKAYFPVNLDLDKKSSQPFFLKQREPRSVQVHRNQVSSPATEKTWAILKQTTPQEKNLESQEPDSAVHFRFSKYFSHYRHLFKVKKNEPLSTSVLDISKENKLWQQSLLENVLPQVFSAPDLLGEHEKIAENEGSRGKISTLSS